MGVALMSTTVTCPFPVGMWIFYDGDNDPSTIWPGTTWQKMEGRFLFGSEGSSSVGDTGGEATHTLTEDELPVIDGEFATAVIAGHATYGVSGHAYGADLSNVTPENLMLSWENQSSAAQYGYGYKFGGGQPHNNMPPYYVTNMWKRTA